ncbi:unnamed protein product [Cladocopium goreaui]|uniref:Uncharacterized protein n=1 Tax=Cladocopium goreaui TaxID=2562237 RepID=A0A9P1BVN7_9DINO|nr:unnamed protein product [Cladocopium goreaui]
MDYFMPRDGRRTLSRALRGHESVEAAQNDLVRLLCYLRMAPFGCDSDVLPNPLHTRKLSLGRPTKWQNIFRHEVAKADAMEKLPGQRKSRQSAWVEITEKARHKAAPSLPTNLAISSGDLVAVHHQGDWKVAAVLTLWRFFKKGNGAQQVTQEIPRGSLHSARVVIMDLDPENKEVYSCNSTSTCVVVPCDNIGLRLDTAEMKKKVNIQGLKILLPEDAQRALNYLKVEFKKAGCKEKKVVAKGRPSRYIKPSIDNFRRSKKGSALIRQEVKRLLVDQAKAFVKKPMLDPNEEFVRYSEHGKATQIKLTALLEKAPMFFSIYFTNIRKKIDFGHRVHKWLVEVSTALKDGSTIPLNGLVAQIASVKCVSNPLEEAAEDQTEESDGNGSD